MLNSGLRILWVKVHIKGGKRIYLNLPISLYVFEELLDCMMDLINIACIISPKQKATNSSTISIHTVKSLTKELNKLMSSLVGSEPYDLVDVEVENVKVSVKIR